MYLRIESAVPGLHLCPASERATSSFRVLINSDLLSTIHFTNLPGPMPGAFPIPISSDDIHRFLLLLEAHLSAVLLCDLDGLIFHTQTEFNQLDPYLQSCQRADPTLTLRSDYQARIDQYYHQRNKYVALELSQISDRTMANLFPLLGPIRVGHFSIFQGFLAEGTRMLKEHAFERGINTRMPRLRDLGTRFIGQPSHTRYFRFLTNVLIPQAILVLVAERNYLAIDSFIDTLPEDYSKQYDYRRWGLILILESLLTKPAKENYTKGSVNLDPSSSLSSSSSSSSSVSVSVSVTSSSTSSALPPPAPRGPSRSTSTIFDILDDPYQVLAAYNRPFLTKNNNPTGAAPQPDLDRILLYSHEDWVFQHYHCARMYRFPTTAAFLRRHYSAYFQPYRNPVSPGTWGAMEPPGECTTVPTLLASNYPIVRDGAVYIAVADEVWQNRGSSSVPV
ncbi:hypothetical protein BJ085DRAFT_28678 [Dimargaris cristalligena]|uniref:Uncharacterized protein n=1 Tax=Dimargaris cristalligena TaxID=215637 RepID=A0A4V1J4F2_9FUNG|nr:hypothetical protein BJ085DRAFT_28678 [Dimargaris cristalligena]|eukprot:RKP35349.1 hypothetical protein BJ085DRAFT_28678 [Dimargaris cristalligena]